MESEGDMVPDTPECESTLYCLLFNFSGMIKPILPRVSDRVKYFRTGKIFSTFPNTPKPPSQDFALANTG